MNYKFKKILSSAVLSLAFIFFNILFFGRFLPVANATEIFFVNSDNKSAEQGLLKVNLLFNTEEESINAVAGKVIFPADLLELKTVQDGSSIINLWVDKPFLQNNGQVSFSGLTPGGYKGGGGFLFSLL